MRCYRSGCQMFAAYVCSVDWVDPLYDGGRPSERERMHEVTGSCRRDLPELVTRWWDRWGLVVAVVPL